MTKATIQSVRQTEKAGLFTICFDGDSYTEFQKFIIKGNENATLQPDLQKILNAIQRMMNAVGFLERYFRPEGKIRDRVAALPIQTSKLRLYCLRLSDSVLIVGNGGQKTTKTYDEDLNSTDMLSRFRNWMTFSDLLNKKAPSTSRKQKLRALTTKSLTYETRIRNGATLSAGT